MCKTTIKSQLGIHYSNNCSGVSSCILKCAIIQLSVFDSILLYNLNRNKLCAVSSKCNFSHILDIPLLLVGEMPTK